MTLILGIVREAGDISKHIYASSQKYAQDINEWSQSHCQASHVRGTKKTDNSKSKNKLFQFDCPPYWRLESYTGTRSSTVFMRIPINDSFET